MNKQEMETQVNDNRCNIKGNTTRLDILSRIVYGIVITTFGQLLYIAFDYFTKGGPK
jgi:hypothetical protein